jgi:hypothetical protein
MFCSFALAQVRFTIEVRDAHPDAQAPRQSRRSRLLWHQGSQVLVEGRSPTAWETALTSQNASTKVVASTWSLPPRR